MTEKKLFDEWPERYDQWFTTGIGKIVKNIEAELIHELLNPLPGEEVLDAGCGTGIFSRDFLAEGVRVVGLDLSGPMLNRAVKKTAGYSFFGVRGDILHLPFKDNSFDKVISVTAFEFIADARSAVDELFRVARPRGSVVVATLNRLSPWADRREKAGQEGHILEEAFFRSPDELLACSPFQGIAKTAVHFHKDVHPDRAREIEHLGRSQGLDTGAFAAVRWEKPC